MGNLTGGQSGSGQTFQNQNSQNSFNVGPWQPQQGPLNTLFGQALGTLQNGGLQSYPGSPVASGPGTGWVNAGTQNAVNTGNAMLANNPALTAGNQFLTDQLSGKYLNPNSNPWLSGMYDTAANAVTRNYQNAIAPQTAGSFEGGNAYNSSGYQGAKSQDELNLGKTLNDLAQNLYGTNYQQGVQNMFGAAGMVPTMMNAAFMPSNEITQAGLTQQGLGQSQLNQIISQYMQNQQLPWQTLGMFKDLVGGNYGQSGTSTSNVSGTSAQPYYSNPLGSILGGGLAGLGVAGQLGWSPFASAASGLGGVGATGMQGLIQAGGGLMPFMAQL